MALANLADKGRNTWLAAARTVLLDHGVDAISIASLARQLGVSRGAFYWHFDTRGALLTELLPMVVARAIPPVFEDLPNGWESGVLSLLDATFLPDQSSLLSRRYQKALADWAEIDPEANIANARLSAERGIRLRRLFRDMGDTISKARIRANLLDRTLFIEGAEPFDRSDYATDLAELFRLLTGRDVSPALLSQHLNRTLPLRQRSARTLGEGCALPRSALQ